jgi:hypothetical protein
MQTRDDGSGGYVRLVKSAAYRLSPAIGVVDRLGMDRDDYAQDLRLRAVLATEQFRSEHGDSAEAEQRYVTRAMWHRVSGWQRTHAQRKATGVQMVSLESAFAATDQRDLSYSMGGRQDAQEALGYLCSRLSAREWETLVRVAMDSGVRGGPARAFDPALDGANPGSFKVRIQRLRRKAKRLLEKVMPLG